MTHGARVRVVTDNGHQRGERARRCTFRIDAAAWIAIPAAGLRTIDPGVGQRGQPVRRVDGALQREEDRTGRNLHIHVPPKYKPRGEAARQCRRPRASLDQSRVLTATQDDGLGADSRH